MNRSERRKLGIKLDPHKGLTWAEKHDIEHPLSPDVRARRVKARLESGRKAVEEQ